MSYLRSILRYRYFSILRKDLRLVRSFEGFNSAYYTSFRPLPGYFKVNPALDYLLWGGFHGWDPSPGFDSSWYLEAYPQVRAHGLNPLVHYLKYGRNEGLSPFSASGGKHIEFIGINGSGKTTLYRKANAYLEGKLGYKPGPERLWIAMLEDARYQAQRENPYVFRSCLQNEWRQFIARAMDALEGSQAGPKGSQDLRRRYFSVLVSFYQAVKADHAKPWLMFDEGFLSCLAELFVDEAEIGQSEAQISLLSLLPQVDLVFYLHGDVGRCIRRMKGRAQGMPGIFWGYSEEGLEDYLSQRDRTLSRLAEVIERRGVPVVRINTEGPVEDCFSQAAAVLDILIAEENK